MSDWRERVREREQDEVRNCKRCVHHLPANNPDDAPVCVYWSKARGRVETIGIGWSGVRNDAPFCQGFEAKPWSEVNPPDSEEDPEAEKQAPTNLWVREAWGQLADDMKAGRVVSVDVAPFYARRGSHWIRYVRATPMEKAIAEGLERAEAAEAGRARACAALEQLDADACAERARADAAEARIKYLEASAQKDTAALFSLSVASNELLRKYARMEQQVAIAREALTGLGGEVLVVGPCDRPEHTGWWDGRGDWCGECGGYQPRDVVKERRPNPASAALAKMDEVAGKDGERAFTKEDSK